MGQIINFFNFLSKNSKFFCSVNMEQAGCHILCSSLRISNWFCLNKEEASQDLVKEEYFLPLSAKKREGFRLLSGC